MKLCKECKDKGVALPCEACLVVNHKVIEKLSREQLIEMATRDMENRTEEQNNG